MFLKNIFKVSFLSKIFILNFNFLLFLFSDFFILLNKLIYYNCFYYSNIVNIIWLIKNFNFKFLNFYISRKFNLIYQKKYLKIVNDLYIF